MSSESSELNAMCSSVLDCIVLYTKYHTANTQNCACNTDYIVTMQQ